MSRTQPETVKYLLEPLHRVRFGAHCRDEQTAADVDTAAREPAILVSRGAYVIEAANMTDEEFERHALSILGRELSADGVARFLRIYRAGSGDYTRDRHLWLEKATIQDIMAEAEQGGRRELGR